MGNGQHSVWSTLDEAEKAFATKCDLNVQIEELEEEIDEDEDSSASQANLDKILSHPSIIQLISTLEDAFGRKRGSLATISDSTVRMDKSDNDALSPDEQQNKENEQEDTDSKSSASLSSTAELETDSDMPYDSDIATYQSQVYGNEQIKLAKQKKKKQRKKKKKSKRKASDDDDYQFNFDNKKEKEYKPWDHLHDKAPKQIKADSRKEDKKRAKIKKSNAEIRKLKMKRKSSNANDLRKRNSSRIALNKKFKSNAHEKVVNFVGTAQLKEQQKLDKIKKQREEIRRIKEKRRLEKEGKIKKKKKYSFAHAHDRY